MQEIAAAKLAYCPTAQAPQVASPDAVAFPVGQGRQLDEAAVLW